ncbi:MAG: exodeoxyribonuclease VII large subunit [Planctomycetes bacterium]|nr:exodeoxyribonuclease VII large subunit [Planctomycetota bacterium]
MIRGAFERVLVAGEVSGMRRAGSGHVYLTLKDDGAQISAVLWRSQASRLRFDLTDGLEVVAEGTVDVYPPRGQYQLVVSRLSPKGIGPRELAFRQLYERLKKEGLFDPARKRRLPAFPVALGVVTSRTGAAIQDILNVLTRRWPLARVFVVPTRVQGEGAAEEIARAIALANRSHPELDLLIVGRGGGSLEDLWAFNEEPVARAIHDSRIPVISAVGHEIDVTIADLVADVRAQTPTEAAQISVPCREDILARLSETGDSLARALRRRCDVARGRLELLSRSRVFADPLAEIRERESRLDEIAERLEREVRRRTQALADRTAALEARLEGVSPLAVLGRGYSVTTRNGKVVRDPDELAPGNRVETRVMGGSFASEVVGAVFERKGTRQSRLFEEGS